MSANCLIVILTCYGIVSRQDIAKELAARLQHPVAVMNVVRRGTTFVPFGSATHASLSTAINHLSEVLGTEQFIVFGASYCAHLAVSAAAVLGSAVKAAHWICGVFPGVDFPVRNGAYNAFALRWLSTINAAGGARDFAHFHDGQFWIDAYQADRADVLERCGILNPAITANIAAWERDAPSFVMPAISSRLCALTGQWDGDLKGTMHAFVASASAGSLLEVGPIGHADEWNGRAIAQLSESPGPSPTKGKELRIERLDGSVRSTAWRSRAPRPLTPRHSRVILRRRASTWSTDHLAFPMSDRTRIPFVEPLDDEHLWYVTLRIRAAARRTGVMVASLNSARDGRLDYDYCGVRPDWETHNLQFALFAYSPPGAVWLTMEHYRDFAHWNDGDSDAEVVIEYAEVVGASR